MQTKACLSPKHRFGAPVKFCGKLRYYIICRYLRDKISQQKVQISTITKGVPMTKIEVNQKYDSDMTKL